MIDAEMYEKFRALGSKYTIEFLEGKQDVSDLVLITGNKHNEVYYRHDIVDLLQICQNGIELDHLIETKKLAL